MSEAEEAQHARQEREAAEEQWASERKKPKLNPFDPNSSVPNWIEPRPSPCALRKIELRQSTTPLSSGRWPPRHFPRTSGTMKTCLEQEMSEAKKHNAAPHGQSHPRRLQIDGMKALLRYQSVVRQEWFGALSRGVDYNLQINEDFLRTCADFINERVRKAEMEEVRAFVTHLRTLTSPASSLAPSPPSLAPPGMRCHFAITQLTAHDIPNLLFRCMLSRCMRFSAACLYAARDVLLLFRCMPMCCT